MTLLDAMIVCSDMRPEDAACVRAVSSEDPGEWFAVDRWRATGPAWTLLQGGDPWAIGGISYPCAWTGLLWMVARPGMTPHSWRKALRATRKVLKTTMNPASEFYRHRVEAHVLDGWEGASKFAAALGLSCEGTRRGAGVRGEDIQVWAWVGPPKGTR